MWRSLCKARTSRHRAYLSLLAAGLCTLVAASSAEGALVTVGQLFPPDNSCAHDTFLQSGVSSGNSYVVPASGQITSWSFQDDATPVTGLKLKVARPAGTSKYTIVGESLAPTQTPSSVNTSPASIPVQAGDIIGIYQTGGHCASTTGTTSADTNPLVTVDAAVGSTMTYSTSTGARFPVSVSVQPTPAVTAISPSSGSTAGGTTVAIGGQNFEGTTAVSFGGAPAASFTVLSDNLIAAVTPGSPAGTVDVSVKNPGQSPLVAGDRFTFSTPGAPAKCVVPKLKGKKLKTAEQALKTATCQLGKVKRHGHKKGKVKKQSPKAGTVLAAGSMVGVTLGK